MKTHFKIKVFGKVQGVSYRAATLRKAKELGLTGYVMNKEDGSVYLEAEGEKETVTNLLNWCKTGPERAEVNRVDCVEGPLVNYSSFEIRR